uniref:Thiol:disulfide interchange protein n=1 Tax=Crouania attenuata TaxID=42002 RepID=A0A4D6WP78_9FLOR|nr:Thiol:disulfide interchange protein [Crouania attenuata]
MNIFPIHYDLYAYYIQQYFCDLINVETNVISLYTLFLLLLAGFFTSLNPCFLSVLPLSISYINMQGYNRIKLILFSLGLSTGFLLIILFLHLLSVQSFYFIFNLPLVSSFIFIVIALSFLQVIDLYSLNISIFSFNFDLSKVKLNISEFFTGMMFSMTTFPCSTPVIISVVFFLSHTKNIFLLFVYMAAYFCGNFLFIFLIFLFLINSINFYLILNMRNIIFQMSGFIMLFFGTLSFLEKIVG